jgi:hypothetical protein
MTLKHNKMKKLVYNTPHGSLTYRSNGNVVLEFESVFMQLNITEFNKFVDYINTTLKHKVKATHTALDDNFYQILLYNIKPELMDEFLKLINSPLYSPDTNYDIFDSLSMMKKTQIAKTIEKLSLKESLSVFSDICPN